MRICTSITDAEVERARNILKTNMLFQLDGLWNVLFFLLNSWVVNPPADFIEIGRNWTQPRAQDPDKDRGNEVQLNPRQFFGGLGCVCEA
jgi:hypothetical protein